MAFLIFLIFFFIYTPPLFSYNILHFLSLISYIGILFKYNIEFINYLNSIQIRLFLLLYFFAILSLSFTILFTTKDFIKLYSYLIVPIEVIPTAFYICCVFFDRKKWKNSIFDLIVISSLLQSFLSIIAFLNIDFKNIIISHFYKDAFNMIPALQAEYLTAFRIFGLSTSLTFAMPVVQGLISSLCFYYSLEKSFKYFIPIPFLLFSALINARTGLLIFIVNMFIILIFFLKKTRVRNYLRSFLIFICIFLILLTSFSFLETTNRSLYDWLINGKNEIVSLFHGEKTGTFAILDEMWILPKQNIFIGNGYDIFLESYYNSDIGFVNILYLGGIIFSFFLYTSYILFFFYSFKTNNLFLFLSIISIFLCNIKGNAFVQSPITNYLFLFAISIYFERKQVLFLKK